MTITCDLYQTILDNQSTLTGNDTSKYSATTILWKSIMKGDFSKVQKLLLQNSSQQSQAPSSNHSSSTLQHNTVRDRMNSNSHDSHQISCSTASFDSSQIKSIQLLDQELSDISNNTQRQQIEYQNNQSSLFSDNNTITQSDDVETHPNISTSQTFDIIHRPYSNSAVNLQSSNFNSLLPTQPLLECALNKYGWTALHTACYYGHLNIVQFLVEQLDINVNQINVNGWNSLFFAVFGGHLDVIDYLLYETSIDTELQDSQQRTALTIAEKIGDQEVIELLKEKNQYNHLSQGSGWSSTFNNSYETLLKSLEDY